MNVFNQAQLGHAFSGWFEVQGNGLTDEAPAAATVGKTVFVFIKGRDEGCCECVRRCGRGTKMIHQAQK
jgi:hypothetical protein